MDWDALYLSLRLAGWTCMVLLPAGILIARGLAWYPFKGKGLVLAIVTLPLVFPPTVLGYYLLLLFGAASPLARAYQALTGHGLVFSFDGLLLASIIFNLPFAIHPLYRAFEAIPNELREAAWCSGMSFWKTFVRIELPLAWPGVISALALCFAHTLGEFGVVLMVGGNISGETRTLSIAIYDSVQAFDEHAAGLMSALLLAGSLITITLIYFVSSRPPGG